MVKFCLKASSILGWKCILSGEATQLFSFCHPFKISMRLPSRICSPYLSTLKEKICSPRSIFFQSSHILDGLFLQGSKQKSQNLFPFYKMVQKAKDVLLYLKSWSPLADGCLYLPESRWIWSRDISPLVVLYRTSCEHIFWLSLNKATAKL